MFKKMILLLAVSFTVLYSCDLDKEKEVIPEKPVPPAQTDDSNNPDNPLPPEGLVKKSLMGLNSCNKVFSLGNKVLVVARGSGYLVVSDDDGASWKTTVIQGVGEIRGVNISISGATVYIYSGSKLFVSTDGMQTWTTKTLDLVDMFGEPVSVSLESCGSSLFLISVNKGFYHSEDNGTTFSASKVSMEAGYTFAFCYEDADGKPWVVCKNYTDAKLRCFDVDGSKWVDFNLLRPESLKSRSISNFVNDKGIIYAGFSNGPGYIYHRIDLIKMELSASPSYSFSNGGSSFTISGDKMFYRGENYSLMFKKTSNAQPVQIVDKKGFPALVVMSSCWYGGRLYFSGDGDESNLYASSDFINWSVENISCFNIDASNGWLYALFRNGVVTELIHRKVDDLVWSTVSGVGNCISFDVTDKWISVCVQKSEYEFVLMVRSQDKEEWKIIETKQASCSVKIVGDNLYWYKRKEKEISSILMSEDKPIVQKIGSLDTDFVIDQLLFFQDKIVNETKEMVFYNVNYGSNWKKISKKQPDFNLNRIFCFKNKLYSLGEVTSVSSDAGDSWSTLGTSDFSGLIETGYLDVNDYGDFVILSNGCDAYIMK